MPTPPAVPRHPLALGLAVATLLPLPVLAAAPSPTELDRVQVKVTTATRTERLLSDVPIRTEVLRQQDIALRAATDFSRAAELINGLRVESNCQNCNTSEVQLLGLPGAYNQLLFDGIPLLSTLGSVYGLEQIPAGFVDRIEVVKGGGSALYGPGAVAGVINLIPPLPARSGGHVQAGVDVLKGTPQKNVDARVDLVVRSADAGLSVVAQRNWNDGIDYNGDGYTEITRKNLKVGGLQAWYAPNPGTRLRLDLQVTDETRRGGNRLDQPEYLANIAESLDTTYRRGSLSWDQEISSTADFRLAYAFADIDRDSFYGGLGDVVTDPHSPGYDPTQLDHDVPGSAAARSWRQYGRTSNPLHYLDSQLNWRVGAHALAFGVQYKHEALRDDNRTGAGQRLAILEDARFRNLGAFVQDEWALREDLDLVIGARVDKSSELDSAVFSPRIAAAWQATPRLKWRAGISTGFRAPEIFVEDVHVDTLGGEQIRVHNRPGLKEERALTTLFGFDWRSDPANPVWSWDATASYARIRDTFALGEIQRDDDGALSQQRYNASGSNVLGVETNLGWQPSAQWRLSTGASWYRSRFREPQRLFDDTGEGGSTVIDSRDYLKTPRWTGLAQLTWLPVDAWEAFLAVRHTGRMQVLNNRLGELHTTRTFWVTDLGARWHRHLGADAQQEVAVSAGVKNLFDQRQQDLEVGALRDSDYVYGPRFARSWYVNLRYAF